MKGELVERVDSYLEYVADEWITENAIAVDTWSQNRNDRIVP